jgi:hypothetical protein
VTFIAAFNGSPCGTCDERIREGQEVEYDTSHRLVHAICPEQCDVPDEIPPICDRCFLTLPLSGVCGNC